MEERIKQIVLNLGADLCGIAHIERFAEAPEGFHPSDIYRDCKSVIMLAKRMPRGMARVNPRIVYNHTNRLTIDEVDRICYEASLKLEETFGCTAVPLPADSPYEYWDRETMTGRGILSMRHAAALAGLGSIGKSHLLINGELGNFITLGGILTDMELKSDELSEDVCLPNCRLCVKNCPSQALLGESTDQSLCRPHTYGVNDRGFDIVKCNTCRTICPRAFGMKD